MFNGITFDDAIPLQQLNTSSLITLRGMLNSVKVNGDLDLTMWDVSNVTDMRGMFEASGLEKLNKLPAWYK